MLELTDSYPDKELFLKLSIFIYVGVKVVCEGQRTTGGILLCGLTWDQTSVVRLGCKCLVC